jgi:hypothetical protein
VKLSSNSDKRLKDKSPKHTQKCEFVQQQESENGSASVNAKVTLIYSTQQTPIREMFHTKVIHTTWISLFLLIRNLQ